MDITRLKKLLAEAALQKAMLKELAEGTFLARKAPQGCEVLRAFF